MLLLISGEPLPRSDSAEFVGVKRSFRSSSSSEPAGLDARASASEPAAAKRSCPAAPEPAADAAARPPAAIHGAHGMSCGPLGSSSAVDTAEAAAVAFDPLVEDSPAMALLREEELMLHRRITAHAIVSRGGFTSANKTAASCKDDGYLLGIQGLHQRYLFHQQMLQSV